MPSALSPAKFSGGTLTSVLTHAGLRSPVVAKTASYTATTADYTILVTPAAATTISLPAAATCTGQEFCIRKMDASANAVTIDPNGAETINGAATATVPDTTTYRIQSDGTNWIFLSIS